MTNEDLDDFEALAREDTSEGWAVPFLRMIREVRATRLARDSAHRQADIWCRVAHEAGGSLEEVRALYLKQVEAYQREGVEVEPFPSAQ